MTGFKTILIILSILVVLPFLSWAAHQNSQHSQNEADLPIEDTENLEEDSELIEEETPAANHEEVGEEIPETSPEELGPEEAEAEQEPEQMPVKGTTVDIAEKMPQGRFLHPREGVRLQGKVKIEFEVEQARAVEFYLRRPESLTETYLGGGSLKGKKVWQYPWLTESSPNGAYFLFTKISNEYGTYQGREILVEVENKIEKKAEEKEKLQELEEEVEETEKELQGQEREIEEEQERAKEEVISQIEELAKQGKEMIAEERKLEAEPEIEEQVEEFSEEIQENIERAVKAKEKEEREAIGREIAEKAKKITEPLLAAPKEEKREEAQKLAEEINQRVAKFLEKVEQLSGKKQAVEKSKALAFAKDTDKDGLPDREEIRLGTDPLNPDSDQDGFLDGSEFKLGFNPKRPSPADKIKYQEPEKVKLKISENLRVDRVEMVVIEQKKGLKIQGKALPHSFVTLYIYSLPVVVIAKADSQGNWEYVLDKPLADGQHRVYATVTNNHGEIEESSEPFVFAKTGERVMRVFAGPEAAVASPAEVLQKSFAILIVGIIVLALGIAFMVMSILLRKRTKAH